MPRRSGGEAGHFCESLYYLRFVRGQLPRNAAPRCSDPTSARRPLRTGGVGSRPPLPRGPRAARRARTTLSRDAAARDESREPRARGPHKGIPRARAGRWAELRDLQAALRSSLPPIVLWFSESEGHYSVVVGLDRRQVVLADPEIGGLRRLPRNVFRRVWFDFSTSGPECGATLYARWMMVVEPLHRR